MTNDYLIIQLPRFTSGKTMKAVKQLLLGSGLAAYDFKLVPLSYNKPEYNAVAHAFLDAHIRQSAEWEAIVAARPEPEPEPEYVTHAMSPSTSLPLCGAAARQWDAMSLLPGDVTCHACIRSRGVNDG